jgi:ornithine cyclodeaminase/alanine dehydrogenase
MPAYIPKMKAAGIKWIGGFPDNYKRNLPYISGLIVLNSTETGLPVCVMDAAWITAKRTGAVTAMTAKYLAKEDSESMGIIGCGVQGRSNLEALDSIFKLDYVKAYDVSAPNLEKYVKEMEEKHGMNVIPVKTPREAVKGCDIIVTAAPIQKEPDPVIEASWFDDGSLACPLDFDSYWKPEAMHSMNKFCTDDKEQLQYYQKTGYFQDIPAVYADLGEIVTKKKNGRENNSERIMSMNLGLAIEDMATAVKVYNQAKKKDVGTWLTL